LDRFWWPRLWDSDDGVSFGGPFWANATSRNRTNVFRALITDGTKTFSQDLQTCDQRTFWGFLLGAVVVRFYVRRPVRGAPVYGPARVYGYGSLRRILWGITAARLSHYPKTTQDGARRDSILGA